MTRGSCAESKRFCTSESRPVVCSTLVSSDATSAWRIECDGKAANSSTQRLSTPCSRNELSISGKLARTMAPSSLTNW